ncbi:MAG: hypothetical protein J0M17_26650 [Planctomycetes bacterium]|nr:hypothetical protein [Planctomycetota bacterium]
MPRPYQFRDYPLAAFLVLAVVVMSLTTIARGDDHEVVFVVEGACCTAEQCAVVDSLSAKLSASRIRHVGNGTRTTIAVRTTAAADPQELWDAVDKLSVRPIRMVIDQAEYFSRPLN